MSNSRQYKGDLDGLHVTQSELEARTGIQSRDLQAMKISKGEYGYPIYDILVYLFEQYKPIRKLLGKGVSGNSDADVAALEISKKQEAVLAMQIKNQFALGDLILKAEAQKRMLGLLKSYQEMLEKFLYALSVDTNVPTDSRQKLEYMTDMFNVISGRIIEDGAEIISWERDGKARLLGTRILDMLDKDEQEQEVADFIDDFTPPAPEDIVP